MATNQDSIISQSVLQTDVSETTSSTSSTIVDLEDHLNATGIEIDELFMKNSNSQKPLPPVEECTWRWIATMKPREQVTEEEKKYIFSSGGLTYLWEHGTRGYLRIISKKHCWTDCAICNGNCDM